MANPHRGQVALNAGGRDYNVSYSINALCELEDVLGQPVAKIAASMNDPENVRMSAVRALVWAGLQDHHPEVTLREAGQIASEASIPVCMEAIGKAFQAAFPEQEEGASRPQKAVKA